MSRSRLREVLCAVLIIVATLPHRARAQDTGIVTGSVVDGTGQVLPGATVTLLNEATASGRTLTTNERGEFTFRAVQQHLQTVTFVGVFKLEHCGHNGMSAGRPKGNAATGPSSP